MPKVVVHACCVLSDCTGSLVWFLRWLELIQPWLDKADHRIVIKAADVDRVIAYLREQKSFNPQHPLFKIMTERTSAKISKAQILPFKPRTSTELQSINAGEYPKDIFPRLNEIFSDLTNDCSIAVFYIAHHGYSFLLDNMQDQKQTNLMRCDYERIIAEFDSRAEFREQKQNKVPSRLGIAADDLGLIFNSQPLLTMQQIFPESQGNSISVAEDGESNFDMVKAKILGLAPDLSLEQFYDIYAHKPILICYMPSNGTTHALSAAIESPMMQQAYELQSQALVICLNPNEQELPDNLKSRHDAKQLRALSLKWVEPEIMHLFLSLIADPKLTGMLIPSGDITLCDCIQYGLLPFYSHRENEGEEGIHKISLFQELHRILLSKQFAKFKTDPGFGKVLRFFAPYAALAKLPAPRISKVLQNPEFYSERAKLIDADSLNIFQQSISPYLRENYDFVKKSLPILTKEMQSRGLL